MSSDAEILSPRAGARAGEAGSADPRRWAALVVVTMWGALIMAAGIGVFALAFLLMLALPSRRGHNRRTASV
jgi:hypothetical protein